MNNLIICILIGSVGYVLSQTIIDFWRKKFNTYPKKPLSCGYCLSFWIGLITFIIKEPNLYAFGYACLCAVMSSIIFKKITQ
jgi:hypothetical protein